DIETDYPYSLPEFLDLCKKVGANPWIILPTTWSDNEFVELGRYLSSRAADHFEEIVVEFGNENCNGIFRPAGIGDPGACGQAADRAFAKLREGGGTALPLLTVVNGQHANPDYAGKFLKNSDNARALAVAPYFLSSLSRNDSRDEQLKLLFANDNGELNEEA